MQDHEASSHEYFIRIPAESYSQKALLFPGYRMYTQSIYESALLSPFVPGDGCSLRVCLVHVSLPPTTQTTFNPASERGQWGTQCLLV